MGVDANIDELAKQLEEGLNLKGQQSDTGATADTVPEKSAASPRSDSSHHDDAVVPADVSDVESEYSVPDSVSSSSSSSTDTASIGAAELPFPLVVHKPLLQSGKTSLFGNASSTLDSIARMIRSGSVKKVIVMAGAGISTSAGIPDFRSPGMGLYANLREYKLPYPEAIFTIDYFRKNPKPFYVLAKELYPGQFVPTLSHFFVSMLAKKGLLLRHYTQNIDCLERAAGVGSDLIVEAHGSFHEAHCISDRCRKEYAQDWVKEQILSDTIPRCSACKSLVKPDITFFGEGLPSRFFELLEEDFDACDLLIVMGTSLQVQPFASLTNRVRDSVPRLLINRERVGEAKMRGPGFDFDGRLDRKALHRDALVLGDCDEACLRFSECLGWTVELVKLRQKFMARHQPDRASFYAEDMATKRSS
ncbi:NAD-dependent protein deacetylase sirtuin-2 [Coemansia guatemalensis]|uniref:NAD-dependent protein deacetylase sirtuin-2 n=1 Tax=Coemansia guatemalensis TaxID=2761395 RepID=A0A9W8LQ04_9FUNG|nr:NAD-dependent protein deacetylase sirtuin-2 [Coemansia guatemalensis]